METTQAKQRGNTLTGEDLHKKPDSASAIEDYISQNEKQREQRLVKASFKWIYNKMLSIFFIVIMILMGLAFLGVISLQEFMVGSFSGIAICLAVIGSGFAEVSTLIQEKS